MTRPLTVAAAQMGPIQRDHTRADVVERLITHLRDAAAAGSDLVVFPELTLTTFFPRWYFEDPAELDAFYEREMPGPETKPLWDEAIRLGVGFALGYAELTPDGHRYNTMMLVGPDGAEIARYRKIHLPGHAEHEPWRQFQHLEKRYFESPPDGFGTWRAFGGVVGMAICNDRRWSETWRCLGLGGAELVLVGYNTPVHNPPAPDHDEHSDFHNHLVMQAGAYQNGLWVVGVAKAGDEEGVPMIGGSCVIAPSGRVVAEAATVGDELVVADIDLDQCNSYKSTTFDFALHRRIEKYGPICTQRGAIAPD
ncbi:MAG: N-carbamoyl-D-amino-acid hydrolase [Actinomycetota bacterium]|nr:N-carbamoyl-D-amino-acid hydrolase [Actinomycetota bacterium]